MNELDELLQPTVTAEAGGPRARPWRVQSQFWVAFFGGVFAVTVIAVINAKRLGVPAAKQRWMIVLAVVTLVVLLGFWLSQPATGNFADFLKAGREMRFVARIAGVVLFLALAALQRTAEAHYNVFADGEYASLWSAGLAATFLLGTLQPLALAGIAWLILSA